MFHRHAPDGKPAAAIDTGPEQASAKHKGQPRHKSHELPRGGCRNSHKLGQREQDVPGDRMHPGKGMGSTRPSRHQPCPGGGNEDSRLGNTQQQQVSTLWFHRSRKGMAPHLTGGSALDSTSPAFPTRSPIDLQARLNTPQLAASDRSCPTLLLRRVN